MIYPVASFLVLGLNWVAKLSFEPLVIKIFH